MIPWHTTSIVVASCAWLIAAGPGSVPVRAAAQAGGGQPAPTVIWRPDSLRPGDIWNTLTLDMKVQRRRLAKSGETFVPSAPVTNYTIQRSSASGRWKTVVRVRGVDRAPAYALSGALIPPDLFPVARIEDDEDGSTVRVYDQAGRLMPSAGTGGGSAGAGSSSTTTLPRSSGLAWIDSLVATTAKRSARLQALEQQFGPATTTGTVSRFLRTTASSSDEIVFDPVNVVPLETNSVVMGRLLSHRTFTYAPAPDGVVRAGMHAETLISLNGDRVAIDTTFSNIRLELQR